MSADINWDRQHTLLEGVCVVPSVQEWGIIYQYNSTPEPSLVLNYSKNTLHFHRGNGNNFSKMKSKVPEKNLIWVREQYIMHQALNANYPPRYPSSPAVFWMCVPAFGWVSGSNVATNYSTLIIGGRSNGHTHLDHYSCRRGCTVHQGQGAWSDLVPTRTSVLCWGSIVFTQYTYNTSDSQVLILIVEPGYNKELNGSTGGLLVQSVQFLQLYIPTNTFTDCRSVPKFTWYAAFRSPVHQLDHWGAPDLIIHCMYGHSPFRLLGDINAYNDWSKNKNINCNTSYASLFKDSDKIDRSGVRATATIETSMWISRESPCWSITQ